MEIMSNAKIRVPMIMTQILMPWPVPMNVTVRSEKSSL
jgi:hypothetical protein